MADGEATGGQDEGGGDERFEIWRHPRPHDGFFKLIFSAPEPVRVVLEAALPEGVLARLDLGRVGRLAAASWDEGLAERDADLLFAVRGRDGRRALLRVLVEHQSTRLWYRSLRVAEYKVRDLFHWVDASPAGARELPAHLAVVVYHGAEPWEEAQRLSALYRLAPRDREALGPYLLDDAYFLDDLTRSTQDELLARSGPPIAVLALMLMKEVRSPAPDVPRVLRLASELLRALRGHPESERVFRGAVEYIQVTSDVGVSELTEVVREAMGDRAAQVVRTTAEKLRAEGHAEGRVDGARGLLARQMAASFGPLAPEVCERLEGASPEELERWGERILDASSLAEVFAEA